MEIATSKSNGVATLRLRGRFGDMVHRDVRTAAKTAIEDGVVNEIEIDFGGVDYIDSNALGMLLLVRYDAQAAGKTVSLCGAGGMVKQVLDMTNFSKLFALKRSAS